MKTTIWIPVILIVSFIAGYVGNTLSNSPIPKDKVWPKYDELAVEDLAEDPQNSEELEEPQVDPAEIMTQVFGELEANMGQLTDINLAKAKLFYEHAREVTLWVDARDDTLFQRGHIKGAIQVHYYEMEAHLGRFQEAHQNQQPLAVVVYCKGKDCHDSHFLAEELMKMGFSNLFVYRDGFDDWHKAGLPIEGELSQVIIDSEAEKESAAVTEPDPKTGMYLEHIVRDLLPVVLAVILLFAARRQENKPLVWAGIFLLAAFFVFAAIPKISMPLAFAKTIWNYDIAPSWLVNLGGMWLPWLEVITAIALIIPQSRKAAIMILGGLLVLFVITVSYNVLRGHDFQCGCTTTKIFVTKLFLEGWNEKILLILRDIGLLVLAYFAWPKTKSS